MLAVRPIGTSGPGQANATRLPSGASEGSYSRPVYVVNGINRGCAFGAGTTSRERNSSIPAAAIAKLATANIHGRARCHGCDLLGSETGTIPTLFGVRLPSTRAMKRYPR